MRTAQEQIDDKIHYENYLIAMTKIQEEKDKLKKKGKGYENTEIDLFAKIGNFKFSEDNQKIEDKRIEELNEKFKGKKHINANKNNDVKLFGEIEEKNDIRATLEILNDKKNRSRTTYDFTEEKTLWIIDRLKSAKNKIDFKLINENPRGRELKSIAAACANCCQRIIFNYNSFIKINGTNQDDRLEFDLLYLFENDIIFDKGFKIPTIKHSTHHEADEFEKRLVCGKYWIKKLRNTVKQNRWMIFAMLGAVGRGRAKYCPVDGVEQYLETRRAQEDFLNNTVARNKNTGEEIKLVKFASNGHTRFAQLHRMSVGIEDMANKKGMVSAMITLTVPGEFHINAGNWSNDWDKSNFASYKESNDWIAKRWQKILIRLQHSNTEIMGLRVSESHSDGTPHHHVVIYFKKKNIDRIKNVIADIWNMTNKTVINHYSKITGKMLKKKTIHTSYHENGQHVVFDKSVAVQWLDIDPKKGRASSYLVKYISKTCLHLTNLTVNNDNEDDKKKAREFTAEYDNFIAVAANRSTWGTRAFAFFGVFRGAITLWQQYRKQNILKITDKLEKLRVNAACTGDFLNFMELMEDENERPTFEKIEKTNMYGGITKSIIGYKANDVIYQTKFDDYKLVTIKNNSERNLTYKNPRNNDKYYNISVNKDNIIKIFNKIKRNRLTKKNIVDFLGSFSVIYNDDPVFWS